MDLDYTIESPQERLALVNKILEEVESPSPKFLEKMSDYLINSMSKQERQQKKILTTNRLATINKHETSFEGLVDQFENGEDGVYGILTNNKHDLFQPKIAITTWDRERIPELEQTDAAISGWSAAINTLEGKDIFIAKKALIESRKDQYCIKIGRTQPVRAYHSLTSLGTIDLDEKNIYFDDEGYPHSDGISLLNPVICSAILCNYNDLKLQAEKDPTSDLWSLMDEFDNIYSKSLDKWPILKRIAQYKIEGDSNEEIASKLIEEFGKGHSLQYISSVWRQKIPSLIASAAVDKYLDWYYLNEERGRYKRCSRCGEIKLAHPKYFSKNPTSKDGFYSLCRECRSTRTRERKIEKAQIEENGEAVGINE